MNRAYSALVVCSTFLALAAFGQTRLVAESPKLELAHGDHISIIGNTLADRMQHDGWLETVLHARFPEHELRIRNLGFSGDELTLRLRSSGFGSPDEHLKIHATDVVFAFFGYNESYAGEAGLEKFKSDLANFIKRTKEQKYNGKTNPRVVVFSPIAHENLKDRHLPDGSANNPRLKLYTQAMSEVAASNGATFVDLFGPTQAAYAEAKKPLTINGVHLNESGNRKVAEIIDAALFADRARAKASPSEAELQKLRAAVVEKNFYWFNRYRTTDGFSIYGGRADLRFVDGQTNRVVAQREMEVLDVMTANRDQRIWALARGSELKVEDANTPAFLEVKTNKPGPLPGGKHIFQSGEASIDKMTVAKGMKVNLFASEEQFPELVNPVQMAFDTKGRLWVAAWRTYPHWKPKEPMDDKLLILEDTDGDGKADKCKTFAGDLHNPTGFEFWNGGVLVAMAPDLMFLKDTDGDDKYDVRERVLGGLCSADTHHTSNSFTFDPGGALYFQEGTFHHTQVESPWGPSARCANGGVFRYEPRTHKFDVYVSYGFANPHGHAFDRWGQSIVVDGTGSQPYHTALFSGHVNFPDKHRGTPQVYNQRTRPCPAIEYLSSRHFPDDMQGDLIVGNVIGFQGLLRYKIEDRGGSLAGTEMEPILSSSDENFRPTDMEIGPDGAIYMSDWQNPIIGHMQHNLRDPSRDQTHGRVYRITYPSRALLKPAPIAGEPIERLLDLLKVQEDRIRYRAKLELSARNSDDVLAALDKWVAALNTNAAEFPHHLLEALWLKQFHDTVDEKLLGRVLESPDFRARAAATRVLCYWRDRVPNSLEMLKKLAADEHPRVRLEAVRAASFFTAPDAVEVPIIAAEQPADPYVEFVSGETMRTIEPYWKAVLAKGETVPVTTDAGARFFLKNMSNEQLLAMPKSRAVYLETLYRPGLQDAQRSAAVRGLAADSKKPELAVLLEAVQTLDGKEQARDESVVFDLLRLLAARGGGELATARGELEKLATSAKQANIRQVAFVTLIAVDGSADKAWSIAAKSVNGLRDLLAAVPLISDGGVRASLYTKIEPLLTEIPANLGPSNSAKGTLGRFVRIELRGRRTLTLAEVEVYSDGRNVARGGKAKQKNTAHSGDAARAIDGNTSDTYGAGGQTHTEENTRDPWWEVDLGEETPIDRIVVYNRADGGLGERLNDFTLQVLNAQRTEVFVQRDVPTPKPKVEFALEGGGPAALIRRAAMNALVSVRGQEPKTFGMLSKFIRDDVDRVAAIRAIQRLPRETWPKDQAAPLVEATMEFLRKTPVADRTGPAALDAQELAYSLTTLLDADAARKIRADLGDLGVRVIRVGTLLERMAYDKELIAVKAGKPVEFLFENTDLMPHNFVIVKPGSLSEVGQLAEATAQDPKSAERQFVPPSDKVLLGSQLIQPRGSQKLSFTAPKEPGVYPFVCTYPGHWRRMYGALYVVEDLDAYLADPEKYLAANPLPIRDELLKDRRPRTEWKFDDLATAIEHLQGGRSFNNGKHLFQVANCAACHKLDGVGSEFGPDLAKLDAKFHPVDILKEMLEPSAKINEKFYQTKILTEDGATVTGLIIKETDDSLTIIENPLAAPKPVEIAKNTIDERQRIDVSLMPKGLLDKLTRDEILDLVAYIACRGDKNHPLFKGDAHDHGHDDEKSDKGGHDH
jgi:putative heme-binding domain-containing protein